LERKVVKKWKSGVAGKWCDARKNVVRAETGYSLE